MTKLSSDAFSFQVEPQDHGFRIQLTQTKTGKVKEFFQVSGSQEGITKHMASLTDEQCKSWFKG